MPSRRRPASGRMDWVRRPCRPRPRVDFELRHPRAQSVGGHGFTVHSKSPVGIKAHHDAFVDRTIGRHPSTGKPAGSMVKSGPRAAARARTARAMNATSSRGATSMRVSSSSKCIGGSGVFNRQGGQSGADIFQTAERPIQIGGQQDRPNAIGDPASRRRPPALASARTSIRRPNTRSSGIPPWKGPPPHPASAFQLLGEPVGRFSRSSLNCGSGPSRKARRLHAIHASALDSPSDSGSPATAAASMRPAAISRSPSRMRTQMTPLVPRPVRRISSARLRTVCRRRWRRALRRRPRYSGWQPPAIALVSDDVTPSFAATILRVGGSIFFLDQVLVQGAFAVAVFGYRQEVCLGLTRIKPMIASSLARSMPFTPAASVPCFEHRWLEANGHAAFGGQQHMVVGLGANHPIKASPSLRFKAMRPERLMFLYSERAERLTRPLVARTNRPWCLLGTAEVFQGEHADNGFVSLSSNSCRTDRPAEVREASGTS